METATAKTTTATTKTTNKIEQSRNGDGLYLVISFRYSTIDLSSPY